MAKKLPPKAKPSKPTSLKAAVKLPSDATVELQAKVNQLESENQELGHQLNMKESELAEMQARLEPLEAAVQAHTGLANAAAELAHIKTVISPFVKCAKGEGTTGPADWEALKAIG